MKQKGNLEFAVELRKIEEKTKIIENSYPVFQIKEVSGFQRSFNFSALFVIIGKLIIFSKQNMFRFAQLNFAEWVSALMLLLMKQ